MEVIKNYTFKLDVFCGTSTEGKKWLKCIFEIGRAFLEDGSNCPIPAMRTEGFYDCFVNSHLIDLYLSMFAAAGAPKEENGVLSWHFVGNQTPEFFRNYLNNMGYVVKWDVIKWDEDRVLTRDGVVIMDDNGKPKYKRDGIKFAYLVDPDDSDNCINGCREMEIARLNKEWVPYGLASSKVLLESLTKLPPMPKVEEIAPGAETVPAAEAQPAKRSRTAKKNE
jgi:hypothetical protein